MRNQLLCTLIVGSLVGLPEGFARGRRGAAVKSSRGLLELQMHLVPNVSEVNLSASEIYPILTEKNVIEREELALAIFERGHFPSHLRHLKPITIKENGHQVTFWVMPDYLAVGSDDDFMLMPLNFINARRLANSWGFILPTRKMVEQIYQAAELVIWPKTYPPGPEMNSMEYIREHSNWIHAQRYLQPRMKMLTAGHKKDIVLSPRLTHHADRMAIYGWQNIRSGEAIQPLSIWHGERYVDYSHGIRMVGAWALVDGHMMPIKQLLADKKLAWLLSDEGPFDVDTILQNATISFAHN